MRNPFQGAENQIVGKGFNLSEITVKQNITEMINPFPTTYMFGRK
jgi:hypothetical protein